jgi:hypothetical protein
VQRGAQWAVRRSGAIAGDAGKGAAIGAVAGTMAGGARQRRKADAAQAQAQANQQQSQQALATYNRAFAACLEGRRLHDQITGDPL